jgi:flavin-dependent dehydrogenase
MGSIESPPFTNKNDHLDYDVLIIGAGLSGIYTLHQMRTMGLRARVLEAASGPGGTWFWNRYPGAVRLPFVLPYPPHEHIETQISH